MDVPEVYMTEARAELAHLEARAEREWHEAVTAELVACTLGQRQRPELRMDTTGRMLHAIQSGLLTLAPRIDRLMAELRAYRYPTA